MSSYDEIYILSLVPLLPHLAPQVHDSPGVMISRSIILFVGIQLIDIAVDIALWHDRELGYAPQCTCSLRRACSTSTPFQYRHWPCSHFLYFRRRHDIIVLKRSFGRLCLWRVKKRLFEEMLGTLLHFFRLPVYNGIIFATNLQTEPGFSNQLCLVHADTVQWSGTLPFKIHQIDSIVVAMI